MACGFAACTGDVAVMLDADGSADPAEIPRFVAALLHGADFAKGSRFMSGGGSADITRLRAAGNWVFKTLVNLLYGAHYTDLCYGYNAFWLYCLPAIDPDCDGFEIETLINIRIAKSGLTVHEVPSMEGHRLNGVSNLRAFSDGLRVLRTILFELRRGSGFARMPNLAQRSNVARTDISLDGAPGGGELVETKTATPVRTGPSSGNGHSPSDLSVLSYDVPEPHLQ